MKIEYFGTTLDSCGHYRFNMDNGMEQNWLHIEGIPFNPESFANRGQRGDVEFHQINEFSALAIVGSCKDTRPGSKSVFWVNKIVSMEEMKTIILDNKSCKMVIDALPFNVKW
jgi:hypothetical protein